MPLQDTIADIQAKLKSKGYPNEQAISQGIVLRLLQELGWDTFDTQVVIPEYTTGKGRVDFALCVQRNKPFIFIEVKQPGNLSGADEQVFSYAFQRGTPFIIVTDGKEWHFYLPTAPGNFEERKVYNLDLMERDPAESEHRLQRYLAYGEVESGNALRNAQLDHESETKKRKAVDSIPDAWGKLLEEKDKTLLDILSDKVESLCGHRPESKKVFAYLCGLQPRITSTLQPSATKPTAHSATHHSKKIADYGSNKTKKPTSIIRVVFPDGTEIYHPDAVDTFTDTFKKIGWEKVQSLNLQIRGGPLVSQHQPREDWDSVDAGFFVYTGTSTDNKIRQLREVSTRLSLGLEIEKKPKQGKLPRSNLAN